MLSPALLPNYLAAVHQAGLKPEQLDSYRPWLVRIRLAIGTMREGPSRRLTSVDRTLTNYALQKGREIRYFETTNQQIDLLANMDLKSDLSAFELELSAPATATSTLDVLVAAWRQGNTLKLTTLLDETDADDPAAKTLLRAKWNQAWLRRIENFLAEPHKRFFVTVGAAHLSGPEGLVALLCTRHWPVERTAGPDLAGLPTCVTADARASGGS